MVPLLAISEDTLLDLVQKGGVIGILLVLVYLLGRMHLKSVAEKDAQIARGQEREMEYVTQRAAWTTMIEKMAENDQQQTAATKDLAMHFAAFRTRFDEHEDRCNRRREGGD